MNPFAHAIDRTRSTMPRLRAGGLAALVLAATCGCGVARADAVPDAASLRKHVSIVFSSGWRVATDEQIAAANRTLKDGTVLLYGAIRRSDGEEIDVLAKDAGNLASPKALSIVADLKAGKAKALEAGGVPDASGDVFSDYKLLRLCGSDGFAFSRYTTVDGKHHTQYSVKAAGLPLIAAEVGPAKADADAIHVLESFCVMSR